MKPEDLLRNALEIHAPWQIIRMRNDLGKGQIDLWVAQDSARSGWFFGSRSKIDQANERIWRHFNIGNARCIVHAVPPSGPANERANDSLQWLGEDDQPFTHGLSRKIAGMFMEGLSFPAICSALDISVTELWKFKYRLDSGQSGLSGAKQPLASDQADSAIPGPNDPIWEKLLEGSISIDIRILSLKLLFTKLRGQFSNISDSEVRILKAHEMQRYFVRHEKLLGHELAQITRF